MDNPDSVYLMCEIDGRYEYELTGNVGAVPYFNLTAAERGDDGKQVTTGVIDDRDVKTDADGNFTIHIGGAKRAQNWVFDHAQDLVPDAARNLPRPRDRSADHLPAEDGL